MPKLRRLSGREVIAILERFDFRRAYQRGSHVRMARTGPRGEHQTVTVPEHRGLDVGTLHSIFRQASQFVPADDLRPWFYRE
jgi:predicted RNA binding protein YcfA (HicA-like mRNA interferase family)